MKFTVHQSATNEYWIVRNEFGKAVATEPDKESAENVARQAELLSGEE